MAIVGIREAKNDLSALVARAQRERVVVTNHGKPVALLVGVEGYDLEDVLTASDPAFWKMIEARRKEPTISSADVRRELRLPPAPARKTPAKKRVPKRAAARSGRAR